jgi:hypothetical protein
MAAATVTSCGSAGVAARATPPTNAPSPSQNPCLGYTCDGPGAQFNTAYPYRLFTHCGVLGTRFDGRSFYVQAVDPSSATIDLNNPVDMGTMTLRSPHLAVFVTSRGRAIQFVDSPPGVVGQPYPFRVLVLSGGNQLIDRQFAGRLWRAQGSLPGIIGPPYGNGQDRFTQVDGTMTLTDPDTAVFRSAAGAQVEFVAVQPGGCD